MKRFEFIVDAEAEALCFEVVEAMMTLFAITEAKALSRINRHWAGATLVGYYCPIYHETPEFYAKTIWYGPDVPWWTGETGLSARELR